MTHMTPMYTAHLSALRALHLVSGLTGLLAPIVTPDTVANAPRCERCQAALSYRDTAYGAAAQRLCKRCFEVVQKARLRGTYRQFTDATGQQVVAIARGPNRVMRRAEQRVAAHER